MEPDKQKALAEVRKVMCERLKYFSFTDEMLQDKSIFQLLNLLELMTGHRNYLGQFSHTCFALEEIFGMDALWDKPKIEPQNTEAPADAVVVH